MGKPRKSSVIIVKFQADIWTQDLSNTKQILPIRTNVRIINADLRVTVSSLSMLLSQDVQRYVWYLSII